MTQKQVFFVVGAKCMVYGHEYNEDGTCKRKRCGVWL